MKEPRRALSLKKGPSGLRDAKVADARQWQFQMVLGTELRLKLRALHMRRNLVVTKDIRDVTPVDGTHPTRVIPGNTGPARQGRSTDMRKAGWPGNFVNRKAKEMREDASGLDIRSSNTTHCGAAYRINIQTSSPGDIARCNTKDIKNLRRGEQGAMYRSHLLMNSDRRQ